MVNSKRYFVEDEVEQIIYNLVLDVKTIYNAGFDCLESIWPHQIVICWLCDTIDVQGCSNCFHKRKKETLRKTQQSLKCLQYLMKIWH